MSHNPTYDPESDHNSYTGRSGDRSGQSTPRGFYSGATLPVSDTPAPYGNMASYRQATTGPPSANYTDVSTAGNGKSYRYATAETIPEDDGDASSPVADSRQVQFTEKKPIGHSYNVNNHSSEDSVAKKSFTIVAILAAVFAALFIIFLALFIWKASATSSEATTTLSPGPAGPGGIKDGAATTTTAPDTIREGNLVGSTSMWFSISNDNGAEVEVLSLGARLNMMKASDKTYMHVFDVTNANTTVIGSSKDGAWLGPLCGTTEEMHNKEFTREKTSDGSLKLTATVGLIDFVFTYMLENNNLMLKITGTTRNNAGASVGICGQNRFNLNTDSKGDLTNSHQLQVLADEYLDNTGDWSPIPIDGFSDFKALKDMRTKVTDISKSGNSAYTETYRLLGPIGLRKAAMIKAGSAELTILTNQPKMKMLFGLPSPDYIELGARSSSPNPFDPEYDVERLLLKPGSTYEYVIKYMMN